MFKTIMRRAATTLPLLIVVTMLAFGLVFLVPGDPALTLAGENPTPEQIDAIRTKLGFDDPILLQYLNWVGGAVQGDFGESLFSGVPVGELLTARMPATLSLAVLAMILAVVVGGALGLVAAATRGSTVDKAVTLMASVGTAIPSFWLGLMLLIAFALNLTWFPAIGYVPITEDPVLWLKHLTLPAITLAAAPAAEVARQLRSALCDTLDNDYVRTARAKGLRERPVLIKHALKNAGIPVVTVIGVQFSFLLGGSIIVEQIFGIPGLGSLAITSVLSRDLPVIQGIVLLAAVAVLVSNLVVDISYGYFNPKVRGS